MATMLGTVEAAKRLKVTPTRVFQLITGPGLRLSDGTRFKLPAKRVGGRWMITAVDLYKFGLKPRKRGRPTLSTD